MILRISRRGTRRKFKRYVVRSGTHCPTTFHSTTSIIPFIYYFAPFSMIRWRNKRVSGLGFQWRKGKELFKDVVDRKEEWVSMWKVALHTFIYPRPFPSPPCTTSQLLLIMQSHFHSSTQPFSPCLSCTNFIISSSRRKSTTSTWTTRWTSSWVRIIT